MIEIDFLSVPILTPVTPAAPGDLDVIEGPHSYRPDLVGVFLRNRNTTMGIIASIRVDAPNMLLVESPGRLTSKSRWPLRFEIRVAPGSQVLLGFRQFRVMRALDYGTSPPTDTRELVTQGYVIEGSYEHAPPLPPSSERPDDMLWFHSIPILGADYHHSFDIAMNLHPNRAIEVSADVYPAGASIDFSVLPGAYLPVFASPRPQVFNIRSIRFA